MNTFLEYLYTVQSTNNCINGTSKKYTGSGKLNRGYRDINFILFYFFLKKVKMIDQREKYILNRSIYIKKLSQF